MKGAGFAVYAEQFAPTTVLLDAAKERRRLRMA